MEEVATLGSLESAGKNICDSRYILDVLYHFVVQGKQNVDEASFECVAGGKKFRMRTADGTVYIDTDPKD
jgi:hypothetical protein